MPYPPPQPPQPPPQWRPPGGQAGNQSGSQPGQFGHQVPQRPAPGYQSPPQLSYYPQPPNYSPNYQGHQQPVKRRSRRPLWIGLAIAVVLLAAVGITGFVTPGYFVANNSVTTASPEQLTQAIVDGINKKDAGSLTDLKCSGTSPGTQDLINRAGNSFGARLTGGLRRQSADQYSAQIMVRLDTGPEQPFQLSLSGSDGDWCWRDTAQGRP